MQDVAFNESDFDYKALNDDVLTDRLRKGSREAFAEIYDRYWSVLYAHVYKMLRDEEEAKDVIQEVFSKLWLNAKQMKSSKNVAGLLYVSARRHVFNLIESKRVRNDYVKSIADFVTHVDPNTVDKVDEKRLREVIEHEIQNLPPKMRQIFELSRKGNLSHKEIAEKLGISDHTVKKQVQNALKIIKPKVDNFGLSLVILLLF